MPLSRDAQAFYKSGGSFLQRHLPFWLGVLAERLLLVLVPLAGVLYPLARLVPAAIAFAVEQRLRSIYVELRRVETRLATGDPGAAEDLAALEERVARTKVPRSGARSLYTLKQHLALVRERPEIRHVICVHHESAAMAGVG